MFIKDFASKTIFSVLDLYNFFFKKNNLGWLSFKPEKNGHKNKKCTLTR